MASRLENYLLSVIAVPGRAGLLPVLLRGLLSGLAALYEIGLEMYLAGETLGLRHRERLPVRVISIGNLTVGGTGKTPMTQFICRRLHAQGKRVAVLSRGHGGEGKSIRVVSDGGGKVLLTASQAGDEPMLLAKTLPGIPVVVGKDRRASGREALRRFAPDVLVLDDGFQFWQLARDLDIVLLDARRPFDNGYSLPRGLLREPKRHLRRARIVVATRANALNSGERATLTAQIQRLAPAASLYFANHRAVGFVPAHDLPAPLMPLDTLAGKDVLAVSAIAQPQSFVQTLEQEAGARVLSLRMWADHHAFTPDDARNVLLEAVRLGAACVVMTEKDAVKWPVLAETIAMSVYALRIEIALDDEACFLQDILR